MVVEAKFVSSSFSRPSRARPLFSLFSERAGLMVKQRSAVLDASTVSLYGKKQDNQIWAHQTKHIGLKTFDLFDFSVPKLLVKNSLGIFVCWVEDDVSGLVHC